MQKSKFLNKKTKGFASKLELRRYEELKLLQKKGLIKNLQIQPKFKLQDSFKVIKNGKTATIRAIYYIADFMYEKDGKIFVEDTKGFKTDTYKIKRKLFIEKMNDFKVNVFIEVYKNKIEKFERG